jgi:hypothetical protein
VCALYIPEVRFGNVATMEPIILALVPQERYNKVTDFGGFGEKFSSPLLPFPGLLSLPGEFRKGVESVARGVHAVQQDRLQGLFPRDMRPGARPAV